jgi:head-tail adaptor
MSLQKRVILQTRGGSLDDYGQPSDSWLDATPLGAKVKSEVQSQSNDDGKVFFVKTATFTFPRTSKTVTIANNDRLSYDGDYWYIRSVVTDGEREVVVYAETI